MEVIVAALGLAALIVLAVAMFRSRGRGTAASAPVDVPVETTISGETAIVTLDLAPADPRGSAVQRLAGEASARVFAAVAEVNRVDVVARNGVALGTFHRHAAAPTEPSAPSAYGPRPRAGGRSPDDVSGEAVERALGGRTHAVEPQPLPRRPLADHFDLPPGVREQLRSADDPVELVRTILHAGGRTVAVEDDLIRAGDDAIVVVRVPFGAHVTHDQLNAAYLRLRRAGARAGIVATVGSLDTRDVRRRETFDSSVVHLGFDGVQSMADAVAAGADPIRFTVAIARGSPSRAPKR